MGLSRKTRLGGVDALIHAAVERWPAAPAVIDQDGVLTYRELWLRSQAIARQLKRRTQRPANIAILLRRSRFVPVAMLGALQARCAYVPLDPALPDERITQLMRLASVQALITEQQLLWKAPRTWRRRALCIDEVSAADLEDTSGLESAGDELAYVLFTSGSTGIPKAVAMPHGPLLNLLHWQLKRSPAPHRTLQFAPTGFDVAFQEIFSTLAAGACLVVLSEIQRRELTALPALLQEQAVTRAFLPPVALRRVAEAAIRESCYPSALSEVIAAGEQLRVTPAVRTFFAACPARPTLENQYGPTETHVVTAHRLEGDPTKWPERPTIGRPIDGASIRLLDNDLKPVPTGQTGEVYVGGLSLARGYYGQTELTAERFVVLAGSKPERLYRTGDLARERSDGDLEYLGRGDDQVKIRGFRVEFGEIDAAVERYPGVRAAATIAASDAAQSDRELVTFYVPARHDRLRVNEQRLRARLRTELPEYLVPSRIHEVDELPISANGKIDRAALAQSVRTERRPAPRRSRAEDLETVIRDCMRDVLARADIGGPDDFFELGGDSLSALDLSVMLQLRTGLTVRASDVFECPSATALAGRLAGRSSRNRDRSRYSIDGIPSNEARLLFMEQLMPGTGAFNLALRLRLSGPVNERCLRSAVTLLLARHESLRLSYSSALAWRRARPLTALPFRVISADDVCAARDQARAAAGTPFDLSFGPLARFVLLRLSPLRHHLVIVAHHVAVDGPSMETLAVELLELYAAECQQRSPRLALIEARTTSGSSAKTDDREYWRRKLSKLAATKAIPTDRPRPNRLSHRCGAVSVACDRRTSAAIRDRARDLGATPFMLQLEAWTIALAALSQSATVCTGIPVSHRPGERTVGMFVDVVPLLATARPAATIVELTDSIRKETLDALAHAAYPFQAMLDLAGVRREANRHPIFQVAFAYQGGAQRTVRAGSLRAEIEGMPTGFGHLDMSLTIEERGQRFAGWLEFASDYFDQATAVAIRDLYVRVLECLCTLPPKATTIANVIAAATALPGEYLTPCTERSSAGLVHQLLAAQARDHPQRLAITCGDDSWTYRQLDDEADRIAQLIRKYARSRNSVVAISGVRSPRTFAAMFGALKSGSPFVPLPVEQPAERQRFVLKDSGASLLLTDGPRPNASIAGDTTVISLDEEIDGPRPRPRHVNAADAAYVLYTSGSTGQPKAVVIPHRGLVNVALAQRSLFRISPRDRVLHFFSLSFDGSIFEMLLALVNGASLHVLTDDERTDGKLAEHLAQRRITVATLTPTVLRQLQPQRLPFLRLLITAGEACPPVVVDTWAPGRRLVNAYGPTETTIWATAGDCTPGQAVTIGHAIPGVRVYVLNEDLAPLPVGAVGEICIAGRGVGLGYLHRPSLTRAAFVPDPFGARGTKMYRTGDLGRYRGDGRLQFLGRRDRQVKIRGFRIELGEVETALRAHDAVRDAAVMARTDDEGTQSLVAYIVPTAGQLPEPQALRGHLSGQLPRYMIPSVWNLVSNLPRTASGKLDETRLNAAGTAEVERPTSVPAETPLERSIAGIWTELTQQPVGRDDDFFDVGGDSLQAVRLAALLRDRLGVNVGVDQVFRHSQLWDFAETVASALGRAAATTL